MKRQRKNIPFQGSTKEFFKKHGTRFISNRFPNRRARREFLNIVPNSTKRGALSKGVGAPVRSIKQTKYKYLYK